MSGSLLVLLWQRKEKVSLVKQREKEEKFWAFWFLLCFDPSSSDTAGLSFNFEHPGSLETGSVDTNFDVT